MTSITERFCSRCLYSTRHPLGLTIDAEGICSGCRIHEEKDRLPWDERWEKLVELVGPYRRRRGENYDCIVPVTGGHDSYWIVHIVKERLGLNPLLVTYNKYFNTPLGIRNLANLRLQFDCDLLTQNVNPLSVKKVTRSALRQFGSIYWPCLAGQTVFPVQTAVSHRVPLIIWGAHQGLEQVGMFSHEHEVQMTRRYRKDHDLMGFEADDLLSVFDSLTEADIWQFRYPTDADLDAVGVVGIYLGNYVRWDPKAQHEQMIRDKGYRTARFARTFDCYDYVDCFNYMDVHDQLKLYKHGYSKVTDHACREIRHGRLTRQQGLRLVRHYEEQPVRYARQLCEWLGVSPAGLQFTLDRHRNPHEWEQVDHRTWEFRGWSSRQVDTDGAGTDTPTTARFQCNASLEFGEPASYITIGKGYPDPALTDPVPTESPA
jgi:N-acetyl sugar amidotransferase